MWQVQREAFHRESLIEQDGRASLAGCIEDAGSPNKVLMRSGVIAMAARGPDHPWQAGSWVRCSLGGGEDTCRESGQVRITTELE